jgi:hypothetical protein
MRSSSTVMNMSYMFEYVSHRRYSRLGIMAFQAQSDEYHHASSYIRLVRTNDIPGTHLHVLEGTKPSLFGISLKTYGYPRLLNDSK